MSPFSKLVAPLIFSVVLVYSGAAWVFLKCSHDWAAAFEEISPEHGAHETVEIECLHPDYQIGPFAVSSSPLGTFHDSAHQATPPEAGLLNPSKIMSRAVFLELYPSYSFFDGSERYLSLSVLRI